MWETWLFWILIGGLVLFMLRGGGCGGHAGHGGSSGHGGHAGPGGPGNGSHEGDAGRKHAHGGCH